MKKSAILALSMGAKEYKERFIPGIQLFQPLDIIIFLLVLVFFLSSAAMSDGNIRLSLLGAAGIVLVMFFVSTSVEILLESLRDVKGIGTLVGFITNGPEALCLVVGLLAGDVLYAASTPLGSNVMNPLMLLAATILTRRVWITVKTSPAYTISCIIVTGFLAVTFFYLQANEYLYWILGSILISTIFFIKRPAESVVSPPIEEGLSRKWFLPALLLLVTAGYFLDPVVSFTAEYSRAPKGKIGFFVLAALTSWPEFKSTLSLLRRGKTMASILNITVSNITNIWLAVVGVSFFLLWH